MQSWPADHKVATLGANWTVKRIAIDMPSFKAVEDVAFRLCHSGISTALYRTFKELSSLTPLFRYTNDAVQSYADCWNSTFEADIPTTKFLMQSFIGLTVHSINFKYEVSSANLTTLQWTLNK